MSQVLLNEALVPDPYQDEEMGARDVAAIADEDLKGSRLLLVQRSVEKIDLDGSPGGAIGLACTFQPALGARFTYAQLVLKLTSPDGARLIDVAPKSVRDGEAVRFTVDMKGKIGVKHAPVEASGEVGEKAEFSVYHCLVQGSGEGTAMARWDFQENRDTEMGLGQDQILTLTVPFIGAVQIDIRLSARVVRGGFTGAFEGVRDLILPPKSSQYSVAFNIPEQKFAFGLSRFFHLS